jgi:plastocyanin
VSVRPFFRHAALTLLALALLGAIAGYAMIANGGLGADHEPGRLEEWFADRALHLSIPSAQDRAPNPRAGDADAWRAGATTFAERCSVCHGADGHGATDLGPRMYPRVPDLAAARVQRFSDGALFAIIRNGIRLTGMPGFHGVVGDDDTWTLVSFVRKVPSLTAADLASAHHAGSAAAGTGDAQTITMEGTRFHPDDLTVAVGTSVTFVNKDFFPHNVQSDEAHLHSGSIDPDAGWSATLATPGTYHYVCTLHPGMSGVIRVR